MHPDQRTNTLYPDSCSEQHTDRSKEWRYDDKLPQDLLLLHPDVRQRVLLYERVSDGNKIMTKMANGDRALTKDEETCPEKIGWYRGDKPEDPDRNKVITKPGTNCVETIWEQCRAPRTEYHERMRGPADILRHPARD